MPIWCCETLCEAATSEYDRDQRYVQHAPITVIKTGIFYELQISVSHAKPYPVGNADIARDRAMAWSPGTTFPDVSPEVGGARPAPARARRAG